MSLSKLGTQYKEWIIHHPGPAGEAESFFRVVSYFLAGRFQTSSVISELLYAASNLLVLINDQILYASLRSEIPVDPLPSVFSEKARLFITILDYVEVFAEISAAKLWGVSGRWAIIWIIQTLKAAWRLVLLFTKQAGLTLGRPIPPLDRQRLRNMAVQRSLSQADTPSHPRPSPTFRLKSGRIIRKVAASPSIAERSWRPPSLAVNDYNANPVLPHQYTRLTGVAFFAELMHISKPLVHLVALKKFGVQSWKPWLVTLALDSSSLYCLRGKKLNQEERAELVRRSCSLLLYLMRSPFYDQTTHSAISKTLTCLARDVPLARFVCLPLLRYIPEWQKVYFYTWSS